MGFFICGLFRRARIISLKISLFFCFSVRFSSLVNDVVEVVQIRKVVKVMVVRRGGVSLVKRL